MDLEKMGQLMNEAVAAEMKIGSIKEERANLKTRIVGFDGQLERLASIQKNKETAEEKFKSLGTELTKWEGELQQRLNALGAEGVSLPFGKTAKRGF